ncbi:SYM9, partial [Symbiodinium sp. KB8]
MAEQDTDTLTAQLMAKAVDKGDVFALYSFGREIGSGISAKVYEGRDVKTGAKVAIKKVLPVHDNVVACQAAYVAHDTLYIILELCTGGDFFNLVAAQKGLSEQESSLALHQLLRGMAHLHKHGVVHRDIKPENILVMILPPNASTAADPAGTAHADDHASRTFDLASTTKERLVLKVADFGFSHALGDPLLERSLVGTVGYLAPEVVRAGEYTPKSDMWAVGVIAFITLAGYPPFWGKERDMWANIKANRWAMHEQYWSGISATAKAFVNCLMNGDAVARSSAEQALAHPFITSPQSTAAASTSTATALRKFNAKRRLRAAVLGVVWGQRMRRARLARLREVAHDCPALSDEKLLALHRAFLEAADGSDSVDQAQFSLALERVGLANLPPALTFEAFDTNSDGQVDLKEFVVTLAILQQPGVEAARIAFSIFDANGDGQLSPAELKAMLAASAGADLEPELIKISLLQEVMDTLVSRSEFVNGVSKFPQLARLFLRSMTLPPKEEEKAAEGAATSAPQQPEAQEGAASLPSLSPAPHSGAGTLRSLSSASAASVGGTKRTASAPPDAESPAKVPRAGSASGGRRHLHVNVPSPSVVGEAGMAYGDSTLRGEGEFEGIGAGQGAD